MKQIKVLHNYGNLSDWELNNKILDIDNVIVYTRIIYVIGKPQLHVVPFGLIIDGKVLVLKPRVLASNHWDFVYKQGWKFSNNSLYISLLPEEWIENQ